MVTYLASKNEGKLAEIRTMLGDSTLELKTYPAYRDPEEGHESYIDNALLKARALRSQLLAAGIPMRRSSQMTPGSNLMRSAGALVSIRRCTPAHRRRGRSGWRR